MNSTATVEDLRTEDGTEFYLVHPYEPRGQAIVYLHWFDEAPNANRSQFLEEAKTMAEAGVTSVLPQLRFPWHSAPTDTEADLARIHDEVGHLLNTYQHLIATDGVEESSVAVVGHDFGAMHGVLLSNEIDARCVVLVAPTPRWSDWFLRFWPIGSDRYDYMRGLESVDPITAITEVDSPTLFQFGSNDFYIAAMTALELVNAASEPKRMTTYESGHAMDMDEIRSDRTTFLAEHLGLTLER